jgi:hypothetical protein
MPDPTRLDELRENWHRDLEAARKRADQRAPPPLVSPFNGGLYGAAFAGVILLPVAGQIGDTSSGICVMIGFAIPFFILRSIDNANTKARVEEEMRLPRLSDVLKADSEKP